MQSGSKTIGWIGLGRMGSPMCERLIKAGYTVKVWNRTRAKATGLEALGATLVDTPADLAGVDVLFTMVSTGKDLQAVYFGPNGVAAGAQRPAIFVDCSSVGLEEGAQIRKAITDGGSAFLAAPVSGNGKCVKAGKLSQVVSGKQADFEQVRPMLEAIAANGVSYVGEGELARICKIAHNVFLGVVTQNLAEITILAERVGVSRHDFLAFINNSVMGSIFTRYKTPALVNLDWTTTFTPELMRKDMDLGLAIARKLDVAMPVAATTREAIQSHFGSASLKPDPAAYLAQDFAAVLETVALQAGHTLVSENRTVASGLET
jgi:3-hydroxyisobutyrate dehydrogenase